MAAGKKKLTHPLQSLAGTRKYLQQLLPFFYFTSSPSPLCSIKEIGIQTQAIWFFGTLVHHLLSLRAFQMESLLVSQLIGLSCGEQYDLGLGNKFWRSQTGAPAALGQPAPVGEFSSKAQAAAGITCPEDLPFKIL